MGPKRISVIGIDGSGKSSTTLKAINSLSHRFSVCKTGRNPFFILKGELSYCLPKIARFFEGLFKKVDATKKREWIGPTRVLFVLFQGWLEPYMIRKYHPDVVMTTRCMVLDSAIYSDFYYPSLSRRMTMGGKLRLARKFSRLPFRDVYFLLETPVRTALARIYKRISDDHPEITYGRDYWLHLHETESSLQLLDQKFREALQVARQMAFFETVVIDTVKRDEEGVAELISEYSFLSCRGDLSVDWVTI
jgi:thymidylate kinase